MDYDDSCSDDNSENSVSLLDESETAPCYSCKKLCQNLVKVFAAISVSTGTVLNAHI